MITIKRAKTRVNSTRDWAVREAERKVKANAPGSRVEVNWKDRAVTVDGMVVFKQEPGDLTGVFKVPYSALSL